MGDEQTADPASAEARMDDVKAVASALRRFTPHDLQKNIDRSALNQWANTLDRAGTRIAAHVATLTGQRDRALEQMDTETARANGLTDVNQQLGAKLRVTVEALSELRINANRLCDRQLGGTYETDCRRSLKKAEDALKETR